MSGLESRSGRGLGATRGRSARGARIFIVSAAALATTLPVLTATPGVAAPTAPLTAPTTAVTASAPDFPAPQLTRRTFANPPKEVRPGTRWWWDQLFNPTAPFSIKDALREVDEFAAAGFGRFEIGWAQQTYGTAEQRAALKAVAERAAQKGLQLDMTMGASWPWHTPTAQGELGQQELMYGRKDVSGPATYTGAVPSAIGDSSPRGKLLAVTAARVTRSGPPVTQADAPPATSTILDPDSLVNLTARVTDGELTWRVPAGDWIIFAFWQRTPETCGAYTNVAGPCVSLIDRASVDAGLRYVAKNQVGDAADAVRSSGHSFFEDSLEYNLDELYWSPKFRQQFAERRGYDVTKFLPLLFVQKVSDHGTPATEPVPDFELARGEGARFRHDYYETLTDLYSSEHLQVIGDWAHRYGMQFRAQPAYGNSFDVTRSAREATRAGVLVDHESLTAGDAGAPAPAGEAHKPQPYELPDSPAWRTAMENYRTLTSGAAQGGLLEVSTELGASFFYELSTSLRDYKRMMDKEWAGGVTRPLLHGYTHSPAGTPWPGASHFGGYVGEAINADTWPEWTNMDELSDYWARGALVLQQGAARTDVAILRDGFAGAPTFDPIGLEGRGYTIGYVDPVGVAQSRLGRGGELFPSGPSYDALVVDDTQTYVGAGRMPGATATALRTAAQRGLKVVFVGDLPRRGTSGRNPLTEDRQVRQSVHAIIAGRNGVHVEDQSQVAAALRSLGSTPASSWSRPQRVYSQLRETAAARYYYLWNATSEPVRLDGSFAAAGAPSRLDLWNGGFEPVAQYRTKAGRVSLPLRLAPHETTVLRFPKHSAGRAHVTSTTADRVVYHPATSDIQVQDDHGGRLTVVLNGSRTRTVRLAPVSDAPLTLGSSDAGSSWKLSAKTYGPEGMVDRPAIDLPQLADWREIPGLTTESGIGTYTTQLDLPASWVRSGRGARLDLGAFEGSVQLFVNGRRVTRDIDPQAPLDITKLLREGENDVKVVLATTPFNKAAALPSTSITRPLWEQSLANGTQTYGLLGPVRLLPFATGEVTNR